MPGAGLKDGAGVGSLCRLRASRWECDGNAVRQGRRQRRTERGRCGNQITRREKKKKGPAFRFLKAATPNAGWDWAPGTLSLHTCLSQTEPLLPYFLHSTHVCQNAALVGPREAGTMARLEKHREFCSSHLVVFWLARQCHHT